MNGFVSMPSRRFAINFFDRLAPPTDDLAAKCGDTAMSARRVDLFVPVIIDMELGP